MNKEPQVLTLLGGIFVVACVPLYIVQPVISYSPGETNVGVDVRRLKHDVRLISTTFSPRDHLHVENLDRVAAYVHDELAAANGRVSDQTFLVQGRTYRNVIASFGPEEGDRIVVGAHYDTFGPNPGADDNASGVAGLLELARLLGQTTLARRVDLVAYTLEEPPYFGTSLMGSAVHAKSLKSAGVTLRCMISLEMIGYFSNAQGSQDYPNRLIGFLYPSTGNFIGVVGNLGGALLVRKIKAAMASATDLPVRSLNAPRFVLGVDLSDHMNYWDNGYDAVMVTDTAFFRNANYHTNLDTWLQLDFDRMGKVVQGVHAAVVDLAK
jgi:hypothetical protein